MSALIEVRGLCKNFPVKGFRDGLVAVDNVSMDIEEGETFGLIGESGSGKTTVGRMILRLLPITRGSLRFAGVDYTHFAGQDVQKVRIQMQMVFQDPYYSLNPRRTVWETVAGSIHSSDHEKRAGKHRRVAEVLDKVHLDSECFDKYPHQLSMGQQQRVGVARAIASGPKFIVLDEPTSSLDISVRGEIISLLVKLQRDLGITYMFISHDLSTVRYLCHKVAVMYLGQVVEVGTVDRIFNHHRHPYSVALLASVMQPDPHIRRSDYKLSGEIPSPINLPTGCYLASRCPEAKQVCRDQSPPMIEIESGHWVRCHFAREVRGVAFVRSSSVEERS